jgi:hypothetical protein
VSEIRWVGPPLDLDAGDVASVDAELGELRHMGLSIGLTLADVEDTVRAWTDWWGVGPATGRDFGIISRSLARRGSGQPWRPADLEGKA